MESSLNRSSISTTSKYVLFDIAGQKYALALEDVVEVIWMVALTSTPAHHDHIEGVINLRGTILPILNHPISLYDIKWRSWWQCPLP